MKNFISVIEGLSKFWKKQGCIIAMPLDLEVGAGTFHPLTFFKTLDNKPWKTAFVQPSRRPGDGRFAQNPLRMQRYYQFQVIIKPTPDNIKAIYIKSLESIGLNVKKHDIRFVEDNWESPTLGASGLGWEVWFDSLEITQFTYFQQMAGVQLNVIPCEITYGLERIAMVLEQKTDLYELIWQDDFSYGDMHREDEIQFSAYNFEKSTTEMLFLMFERFEKESKTLVAQNLYLPAYEFVLKMSHTFNMLEARGVISIAERANYISKIRELAKKCAEVYLKNPKYEKQ